MMVTRKVNGFIPRKSRVLPLPDLLLADDA